MFKIGIKFTLTSFLKPGTEQNTRAQIFSPNCQKGMTISSFHLSKGRLPR